MKNASPAFKQHGFTLIELSIVLVIIGLIVGGVLVGQDLIKSAEQRAMIAQIEKYNSSVNTFKGKFNGLPGDMPVGQAASFGIFTETTLGGNAGHGDGNGLIEGGSAAATAAIGETLTFWRHLSDANLVDGSYGVVGNSLIVDTDGTPTGAVTNIQQSLPLAKLGPAGSVVVYSVSGFNYYQVVPITAISSAGVYTVGTSGMTPIQAYNIDAKVDDGAPNTGTVKAKGFTSINNDPSFNNGALAATCVNGTTATATDATYNRNVGTGGNDTSCSLQMRFN